MFLYNIVKFQILNTKIVLNAKSNYLYLNILAFKMNGLLKNLITHAYPLKNSWLFINSTPVVSKLILLII